jgi:hypothetical protein
MRVTSLGKPIGVLSGGDCARFAGPVRDVGQAPREEGREPLCLAGRVYTDGSRYHEHTITSR